MKSFAGFLRPLVVRWPNWSSWRSLTGFSGTATQFGYATTNQEGRSFIIPTTHQTTSYITPGLVLWARYPGVGEMGRMMACGSWKYFSFSAQSGKIGRYAGRIKLRTSPGTYHRHIGMIVGGTLKRRFVGFVRFFLVWWGYDSILDGDSQILRADEKRRWCSNEYVNGQ